MSRGRNKPAMYTLPPGLPLADALASSLLEDYSENLLALTGVRILLPTRRACRSLRDSFLRLSGGKPLLLPSIQPIGDVDEEELFLGGAGNAQLIKDIPPPLNPLRRQIILSKLVMGVEAFHAGPEQAIAIAGALGTLMDHVYTEGLDFTDLPGLVEEETLARHWQISVEFLRILSEAWPQILDEKGVIDAADRRVRLLDALASYWRDYPPATPVIAAGSTGSIPVTARLLKVIASLPEGRVILPGLDQTMDDESWQAVDDTHPQVMFARLLKDMDVKREDVRIFSYESGHAANKKILDMRRALAGEMMRPAETTAGWLHLAGEFEDSEAQQTLLQQAHRDIHYYECDNEQEEALVIATAFREALQTEGQMAALVTPDRALARRVAIACRRWGVEVDDSGGQALSETGTGVYLRLLVKCVLDGLRPSLLMALLKDRHCLVDSKTVEVLERDYLRGPAPSEGFEGLYAHLEGREAGREITGLVQQVDQSLEAFCGLCDGRDHHFRDFLHAHIESAENLSDRNLLWAGEDGEKAAEFLASLHDNADDMPRMRADDYLSVLEQLMRLVSVRPTYGTHPRLFVLGQLEARMIQADLVILAGLNEGVWPPEPAADPWMSRPMRRKFGLPSPERSIALSAHDFVQGFCSPRVVLTRARRRDGAPTVPARWLQRLETVLQASGSDLSAIKQGPHLGYARSLQSFTGDKTMPYKRPEPRPPVSARPVKLSVTAIEKWMRDPYSIYARYILGLKKLPELEEKADASLRGTIMHDILAEFIQQNKETLPEDALDRLLSFGEEWLEREVKQPALRSFWWPRFCRIAQWFVEHERHWREYALPQLTETDGEIVLDLPDGGGSFTLFCRADRIDLCDDGKEAAIIDYKTGTVPTGADIRQGFAPQLPLEGLILLGGGFAGISSDKIGYIGFWSMTGGSNAGEEKPVREDDLNTLCEEAGRGLITLISSFQDPATPYYSLPRPDKAPPVAWQDYAHLARVQEWTALEDSEETG